MNRRKALRLGLPVLAVVALGSAVASIARSNVPADVPASIVASMATRPAAVVAALGRVEPEGGVRSIAPEVEGTIAEMAVTVGSRVAEGDVLFRIDGRVVRRTIAERQAALDRAKAMLAQTEAQAALARADLAAAVARRVSAEAGLSDAERDLAVARTLAERDAAAAREVERREAARTRAAADLDGARAGVAQAEATLARLDPARGADILAARAAVSEAAERIESAASDLEAHTVKARTAATILSIDARVGEAAGPGTAVLMVAAGEDMILRVFVDEVDAARVDTARPGQATARGRAGETLELVYVSTDPEVRPNSELSGRSDDRIDTRVVEMIYRLPAGAAVLIGETFDVLLPARDALPAPQNGEDERPGNLEG